jgi:hypothetical protein
LLLVDEIFARTSRHTKNTWYKYKNFVQIILYYQNFPFRFVSVVNNKTAAGNAKRNSSNHIKKARRFEPGFLLF